MKLISILDHLAAAPATAAPAPRRALLAQLGRAAVAALPLGAALPAAAAPADTSYDAVTQLLQLERTQVALYTQALAATGLIPAAQTADFQRLLAHQTQHAALFLKALQDAGAIVPALPRFDFSGKHSVATNPELFPNVLTNYDAFLALAQQLEDLGVRIYQTQSINISDSQLLRSALRIHAVEAQHSAHIRGLRKGRGAVVQNWPSEEDATIVRPAAAQALTTAATGGEENGVQYVTPGVPIPFASLLLISTNTAIHDPALAEAFDEPVSSAAAQAALNLFV
ncbi:ferritin-like domain-containing protein [Microvirga sp. STS02]|uniref:ferritin-like domain-containing protein n=1 Tax=Hymenobacter negativus TaxID=2795026 RepID=UPI0018DD8AEF|nr:MULTISPECIES: ferritin-like domain-containing protein [Bacteria]MBH8570729.1 ferritin-like domain-containing protein [Hymenobacter negativus]MBR7210466.1 ferritin-like domain-containing protein [Microvirga sp. STS02]